MIVMIIIATVIILELSIRIIPIIIRCLRVDPRQFRIVDSMMHTTNVIFYDAHMRRGESATPDKVSLGKSITTYSACRLVKSHIHVD